MKINKMFLAIYFGAALSACGSPGNDNPPPPAVCTNCTTSITLDGTVTERIDTPVTAASGDSIVITSADSVQLAGTTVQIPAGSLPADTTVTVGRVTGSTLVPTDV
ncbi:MAG: hypothetical protein WA632_00560, partial [Gallionella sp.]